MLQHVLVSNESLTTPLLLNGKIGLTDSHGHPSKLMSFSQCSSASCVHEDARLFSTQTPHAGNPGPRPACTGCSHVHLVILDTILSKAHTTCNDSASARQDAWHATLQRKLCSKHACKSMQSSPLCALQASSLKGRS